MNLWKIIKNGIIKENPVFVLLLGMCPSLATSTSFTNALGMGAVTTFVLIGSNLAVSSIRKIVPHKIRIASFIVIIAGFTSVMHMLIKAFVPSLDQALGIFIPLVTVNCIVLARAEVFASKNSVLASAVDGLSIGIGFTLALSVIAVIREFLGAGTILGFSVFGESFQPALIMTQPPGGFLVLGIVLGAINYFSSKERKPSDKQKTRSVKRIDASKLKYKLES